MKLLLMMAEGLLRIATVCRSVGGKPPVAVVVDHDTYERLLKGLMGESINSFPGHQMQDLRIGGVEIREEKN